MFYEKEDIVEKKRGKTDLTNNIREKAEELWKRDGCKQDRDLDYWLQAERIVKNRDKITINNFR